MRYIISCQLWYAPENEVEPLIETPSSELLVQAEPVYTNTDDVYPPIKVEDLWDYIRSAKQNDLDGLKKEFKVGSSYGTFYIIKNLSSRSVTYNQSRYLISYYRL